MKKSSREGALSRSVLYRYRGEFRWRGIRDLPYKQEGGDWSDVIRRVLIGDHGETTKFHVRYFEIAEKGRSSCELHSHEHVVICIRGRGMAVTDRRRRRLGFLDVLYVAPQTVHQFSNPYPEPFGFLCIVNARRDRPKVLKR